MPFKLGKQPPKYDGRTLRLPQLLKTELPPVPDVFDVDSQYKDIIEKIPNPIYRNNDKGDCVIVSRCNQTRRFELKEQKKLIEISDDEVLNEYYKEGRAYPWMIWSKPDRGLVMLDSLNHWRNEGWKVGGKEYNIYAYAKINPKVAAEVKSSIYLLNGINTGFQLPLSADDQIQKGKDWDVVTGDNAIPGSLGGHCIWIKSYDWKNKRLRCITWGIEQEMSFDFFLTYIDEAYAIVDNRDNFLKDSPIDVEQLDKYLDAIAQTAG